jgi:hypothetical protein
LRRSRSADYEGVQTFSLRTFDNREHLPIESKTP